MANPLFINRIAINPPIGKTDITFRAGLNVVRAVLSNEIIENNHDASESNQPGTRNSVGKTTFVHLIDYGLGKGTFLSKDKSYARKTLKSHDVLIELRIGEQKYTIQRNLVSGEICYLYEEWVINQLLEGTQLSSQPYPVADYRGFLEEKIFQHTNVYEDTKFVSFRDVMQIIFREQVGGFESLDKAGNYYVKANDKRKLLQYLSGLVTSETLGVDKRVSKAEEDEKEAKKALDIIRKYVNHKVNHAEETIRSEMSSVIEDIQTKNLELIEYREQLVTLQKRSDERTEQKQEWITRKNALSKEAITIQLRINSFQATLNEIETEKSQIDTANRAHEMFDSFEYENCPVCMVPLATDSSLRTIDGNKDENSSQVIETMKTILANEKIDLIETIENLLKTLNDIRSMIQELENTIQKINLDISKDADDILLMTRKCEADLKELYEIQAGLKQDLEFIKDHDDYKRKYGVAKDHFTLVKIDRNRIQQKMKDDLESLQDFFHEAVSYLYFSNRIGSLSLSERAGNFQAEIKYLLASEGRDTGAAAITLAVIAFDLALLKLAIEQNTPHPRLLVHDSPNIRDIEPLVYDRIFTYITDILEKPFLEKNKDPDFQYIITTILMPEKLAIDPYIRLELSNDGDHGKLFEFTF